MFNFRKYILRIILLLISITIFSFIFRNELIKGFNHNIQLNSVIILVFLLGVIIVINNIIILMKDQNWLINLLSKKNLSSNYSPKLLKELKKNNYQEPFFTSRVKKNIERIVEKLDEERELIKYITALLIFLGLIGTFWGLLKTIDSVGLAINNMSIDEENILTNFINLKAGLNAPLAGMGTAFSSSLFGLAGSLCLGFVDVQGGRAQNDFIHMIENKLLNLKSDKMIKNQDVGKEYIQAILFQTIEALQNIEKMMTKSEESRRNFENLIIESSKVIVKVNNEISLRVGQYNKNEVANIEALRSLEAQIKGLKDQINIGKEHNTKELANEIQILAKTISLIKK